MATLDLTEPGAFAKAFKAPFSLNCDPACCPQDDFYLYANGNWLKNNPIPSIYPAWGSFLMLRDVNEERCKAILTSEEGWTDPNPDSAEHTKEMFTFCKTFYDGAMDEAAIESRGYEPLDPLLKSIDSLDSLENLTSLLADLHTTHGINILFSYGSTIDKKNSDMTIAGIYQAGLGLPDRDYYFDEDKLEKCASYVDHVGRILSMIGVEGAEEGAKAVFDFEKKMAESFMTKTELRDPEKTYNLTTIEELDEMCPSVAWTTYLTSVHGLDSSSDDVASTVGKINLATMPALSNLSALLSSTPLSTLKLYMKWHSVHAYANHLSSAFVSEHFEFYGKVLAGTKELKPRWKRAMGMVESALGEALGQLYVEKHFTGASKPVALGIVESVRDALKERLGEVPWMSPETRKAAMEKMSGFRVQIGFPDTWIDYAYFRSKLTSNHFSNIMHGQIFDHKRDIARINAPTDKDRWYMTPQTVNAYYHPSMNLICFPAAILQPPFFDVEADDAVNYGGMGAVVGHEMTHGFDDKGSKYDAAGNMVNWWKESDREEFDKRVDVMVEQAGEFEVQGQKLKGKLTAGENLADLGGLKLSLRALKKKIGGDLNSASSSIDGFTPLQRFFLSWATVWRQNITPEREAQLVTIDPHGPNNFRSNGPLSNMPEFYEAFGIKEGDKMYKPAKNRVDVW